MDDTPRSELFDDVYFSDADGVGETCHVFLDGNNLPQAWQGRPRFTIGETGFGTGLNFLLSWELFDKTAEKGAFLDFISVEKYPLSAAEIAQKLAPWAERLNPYLDKLVENYPMRVPGFHRIVFDGRVALTLVFGDANDVLPEIDASVDAWFLDGFMPKKNPDMWSDTVFGEMARMSHGHTTFATFTAAGFVKRGLAAAGFHVERRKGFGTKWHMLAGHFIGSVRAGDEKNIETVAIMGAGLAGTACAYVLRQYGFKPVLHDPNGIASGASGNPVGLINPRFTAFRSPESDFYTAAFAQAGRTFPFFNAVGYNRCGSLHLVMDGDKKKRFTRTCENWGWHEDHMRYVVAEEAADLSGVQVPKDALYLPDSAQINPSALCRFYASGVAFEQNTDASGAHAVILANGVAAAGHPALSGLPVHTVRGQITMVRAGGISATLKTNLCYGGYISAPVDGFHAVGSTFQKWMVDTNSVDEDDAANLDNLSQTMPEFVGLEFAGHRAALRTAAQDRFPVIGVVPDAPNTFVSTAHGSHGIISTLAGAHLLADFLRGGPFSLGKSTIKALSPHRFAERKNRHGHEKA